MNSLFLKLHEAHFAGTGIDLDNFERESLAFFDAHEDDYAMHDKFFNNFTIIWIEYMNVGNLKEALQMWRLPLSIALTWQKNRGRRLHKGTPFYFMGVTAILDGQLEYGFLLMHQALEEDKKTHGVKIPPTPAYFFVTLDHEKQDQFFRQKVEEIAGFVGSRLNNYCSGRGGNLSLRGLKAKFLEIVDIQEAIFYFVFSMFRLKNLTADIDQLFTHNVFASLLETNVIFDFCLVLDSFLKNRNPSQWKFFDHMKFLASKASLSLDETKLLQLNRDFQSDFSGTLQKLLGLSYAFDDGLHPSAIENDLAIAYGFRNFGAHKIEDQPVINQNFNEISQRILNALFFSVEKLAP